jgi:hypothetical protein
MNRKIKKSGILSAAWLLLFMCGCTGLFEDYNTNQHEATEEMLSHDYLKTGAFFSQMQRNVVLFTFGQGSDNAVLASDYQVAQGLTSDLYSGYIAPTGTWYDGVHNGSYAFITGWIEQTFTRGFTGVMPAWQSMVKIAEEQQSPEVAALATVVKVEAMHRVADAYGPIPYCNYGGGSLQNTYDGLDEVYQRFFEELDDAIDVLTDYVNVNPSAKILDKYDLIYQGDATKWVKFANTLRLRLAMRVRFAEAELAQVEAEKSISNPIGVITNTNERASLKHAAIEYVHPLLEIQNFNDGEARMSAAMDSYLNGYADPRLPIYFKPNKDGVYKGVRLGIAPLYPDIYAKDNVGYLNITNTTEIVWITAAESYFLRAEGVLLGWNMGGTDADFYTQGVIMSLEENGVGSSATDYLTKTVRAAAYTAPTGGTGSINAPSSTIYPKWEASANTEQKLERIITQKWIAMYPDGPEGWAEFRRTGYPRLFPVFANKGDGSINTTTQVRRIPYPQSEYNNNNAGVQSGIAKLGGQDNGGVKLWWDKK